MEKAYTLADAEDHNQFIRIRCYYCRITRNYYPRDLIRLIGILPVYQVPWKLCCDGCQRKEHLKAEVESFSGRDIGKLQMRRLVKVKFVRQVTWEDGVL